MVSLWIAAFAGSSGSSAKAPRSRSRLSKNPRSSTAHSPPFCSEHARSGAPGQPSLPARAEPAAQLRHVPSTFTLDPGFSILVNRIIHLWYESLVVGEKPTGEGESGHGSAALSDQCLGVRQRAP